jgi:hypothetical protein
LDGGSVRREAATYIQNNTNTEETQTDIHASCGIRTHDSSVREDEDGSCLRLRGPCDQHTASPKWPNIYVFRDFNFCINNNYAIMIISGATA